MLYVGPDLSDSDLSDDDYVSYGPKPPKVTQQIQAKILTPEEKLNQQKNQFYNAICSGNTENVKQILEEGFDVNACLQSNWSSLLLAVSTGHLGISEELLKRGADPNSNRDGSTALMMACNCPKDTSPYSESLKVIKLLVDKGADVKATNRKRMTALMFAANVGNLPAVKYLLPLSDKDAEDNQRWTALFWAVNNNEVQVFKYLLEQDLDYNLTDVRGATPLSIATRSDFTEIMDMFPKEEHSPIFDIIYANTLSFDEIFASTKTGKEPAFFLDICDILCGLKSDTAIEQLANKNITLKNFLSISDEELESLGIKMPFQRYRILAGLHKFHKYPFHPKSLHIVPKDETYSNADAAIQILSAVKQLIVMDAGLTYVMKNCDMQGVTDDNLASMKSNIENIKKRIKVCSRVTRKLNKKTKLWDKQTNPVDLINKESKKYKLPWRKIVFSIGVISIVLICRLRK